jgi:hypothetical protein
MYRMTIKGRVYDAPKTFDLLVGGYALDTGWVKCDADLRGTAPFSKVRWAADPSGYNCVILGLDEDNDSGGPTTWNHCPVWVDDVAIFYTITDDHLDGWVMSFVTDISGYTVQQTVDL